MSWADEEPNTLRGLDSDEAVSAFVLRVLRVLPTVKVLDQPPRPALAPALVFTAGSAAPVAVLVSASGSVSAFGSVTKPRLLLPLLLWEAKS